MEVSQDRLEKAIQGLRSPVSLLAFGAWWFLFAITIPQTPPLLAMLVAAWLGTATGTAIETAKHLLATPGRLRAVRARVYFMWDESFELPLRVGRPLRVKLHELATELHCGAITADHAEEAAGELLEVLTREQATFFRALEEGKVKASVLEAILHQDREYLNPRGSTEAEKTLRAITSGGGARR